jgi:N-dimethylarginine dimethylaminohydrolase
VEYHESVFINETLARIQSVCSGSVALEALIRHRNREGEASFSAVRFEDSKLPEDLYLEALAKAESVVLDPSVMFLVYGGRTNLKASSRLFDEIGYFLEKIIPVRLSRLTTTELAELRKVHGVFKKINK